LPAHPEYFKTPPKDLATDVQILKQKHKKYDKKDYMTLLKINNSTIIVANNTEVAIITENLKE
jgi:hypothetical protein